jgi:4'-phosphopantetheinyl transferase
METPVDWQAADALPPLAEGNVHVWRSSIQTAPPYASGMLDAADRERLSRIRTPAARAGFVAARLFVRTVLARYLDGDPAAIRFAAAPGGKPRIGEAQTGLEFNLSHSHGLALLAVGRQALGVDLERLRPIRDGLRIARRVLPAADIEQLERVDEPARSPAFLKSWTRFEARQKALGHGVFAEPATDELTRSLAFRPDAAHLACLAWLARDLDPKVSWFGADI